MNNSKVSIVMSVYNGETNVESTINSVLEQSYKDFEFIIINDHSTDGTSRILSEYMQKDQRIKVITNKKNLGLSSSLVKGIESSKGTFIARIDSGDLMKKDRLKQQREVLLNKKEVGLVTTNCIVTYLDGEKSDETKLVVPNNDEKLRRKLPFKNMIPHVSVMFRKDIYSRVGGYDGSLTTSQDFDLWIRILKVSKAYSIQEFLTEIVYDSSLPSISLTKNKEQRRNNIIIMKRAIKLKAFPLHLSLFGLLRKYVLKFMPLYLMKNLRYIKRKILSQA